MPLNDSMLSPIKPIWILHGGDHFSVLFADITEYPQNYQEG